MPITITTAASDRKLLTEDELREAIGVPTGQDTQITALNARLAAAITAACQVARAGATPPTLRKETITEKLYFDAPSGPYHDGQTMLILSRGPIVKIISITEDDVALTPDTFDVNDVITTPSPDYEIDGFMVRRLSGGRTINWGGCVYTVVYQAGYATVPDELKQAAAMQARHYWAEQNRESGLRSQDIPGVLSQSWQDKPDDASALLPEVIDLLQAGGFVRDYVG